VLPPALVLAAVATGIVPGAAMLASARWPRRSPAAAIVLWQSLGLGWGLAAVGALVGFGAVGGSFGVAFGAVAGATQALRDADLRMGAPTVLAIGRLAFLGAGALLLALLCWVLVAAAARVFLARHRHRTLLRLLAHGDPKVPGALVVDHPAAAAYCLPGLRSQIVISAGTIDLLGEAELAAVLAHERAHLRARHDLVLLPFSALRRAFPRSAIARRAQHSVALLIEMLADDRVLRHRPARELAMALLRVGASGLDTAPSGALAGAPETDGEMTARVSRLLTPVPRLPRPALALVAVAAAAIVAVPATLLLLPL
jgi:hypothetical protein